MARSVSAVQTDFALNSGLRSEIIWDTLASDQSDILHQKIKTIIPDNEHSPVELKKRRKILFENIWSQRKYTNGTLLSTIIYVLVTDEHDPKLAKKSTLFSCHPVFRTRRCTKSGNSLGCCMIFIDEHGRVYQNWHQFIRNNVLPKGLMIAPLNGVYTFNYKDEVELETHLTALTRSVSIVLDTTDKVATVGGLAATVPIAAAVFFPVAAPVVVTASAVMLTTALYSTARSAMHLFDRSWHEQSISYEDEVARKSWLGITVGAIGLGAAGATKALTSAATAGSKITFGAELAVNGINTSSILLTGARVVNGVFDLYIQLSDNEKISNIDMLQLSASLLLFTHSMNNLRVASAVGTCLTVSSLRMMLNEQIRSQFSKTTGSAVRENVDILRIFNDIPIKKALMSLHMINANLPTVSATGLGAASRNGLLDGVIPLCGLNVEKNLAQLETQFGRKFTEHILNPQSFLDVLDAIAQYLSDRAAHFILDLAHQFLEDTVNCISRTLNIFISTENVLHKMLMHCVRNYANLSYNYLESKTEDINTTVEKYFRSLQPDNNGISKSICEHCNGHFYVCEL